MDSGTTETVDMMTSTVSPIHDRCMNISDIVRLRRRFDFGSAVIGCILSTIHLSVLVYLQYVRNRKSFEYLLAISALSVVTLFIYATGCIFDLCILPQTSFFLFYRGHLWLFVINMLLCTYGYMIVILCLDRFVALHKPVFYKQTFVRPKVRIGLILASFLISCLCCIKWFFFDQIDSDKKTAATNITDKSLTEDDDDGEAETDTAWFVVVKSVSCIVQYFVSGLLMIVLSVKNVQKLHQLNKKHALDGGLRMVGRSSEMWQQSHKTVAKICIILASTYCLLNWPYGLFDWFYSDVRNEELAYGIAQIVINLCQAFHLQLNLFLFAYSSRIYRSTLIHVLKSPFRKVAQLVRSRNSNISRLPIADASSVSASSVTSRVVWF